MARTYSNMLALNSDLPSFELFDVITEKKTSINNLLGTQGTVIMFICNHCPYVVHIFNQLVQIIKENQSDEIKFIAINSNDVKKYPADAPSEMKKLFDKHQLQIPFLFDETQEIAKLFDAACTPDFYLFDASKKLIYRGQFDDSRPSNEIITTGKDLLMAINCVKTNLPINFLQKPSLGCNIKWKTE